MNKFNVGDILKSKEPNFSNKEYIYVLVLNWTDSNKHDYTTPIYTVFNFNKDTQYQWNSNHVEYHYERAQ